MLVLDDPLSALDVDTEALVEEALRRVLASTTALIVAHRPSTVMLADRVALLEDGRITAVGTHSELLRESEHYRYVISSLEDEGDARPPRHPTASSATRRRRRPSWRSRGIRHHRHRTHPARGGDPMSVTGVEGEERHDYTKASQADPAPLAAPARVAAAAAAGAGSGCDGVVVVSTVARVAGPALIAYGIDQGLPALLEGDWMPVGFVGVAYLLTRRSRARSSSAGTSGCRRASPRR